MLNNSLSRIPARSMFRSASRHSSMVPNKPKVNVSSIKSLAKTNPNNSLKQPSLLSFFDNWLKPSDGLSIFYKWFVRSNPMMNLDKFSNLTRFSFSMESYSSENSTPTGQKQSFKYEAIKCDFSNDKPIKSGYGDVKAIKSGFGDVKAIEANSGDYDVRTINSDNYKAISIRSK